MSAKLRSYNMPLKCDLVNSKTKTFCHFSYIYNGLPFISKFRQKFQKAIFPENFSAG